MKWWLLAALLLCGACSDDTEPLDDTNPCASCSIEEQCYAVCNGERVCSAQPRGCANGQPCDWPNVVHRCGTTEVCAPPDQGC